MNKPAETTETTEKVGFWEVLGSTFAGALGVQSFKNRKRDFTHGNPVHFIISGVIFTACFVIALITLVDYLLP